VYFTIINPTAIIVISSMADRMPATERQRSWETPWL
jgi:hypothetical protein